MWLHVLKSTGSSQAPLWGWIGFCAKVSQGSPGLDCPLACSSGHIHGTLMIHLATRNQRFHSSGCHFPASGCTFPLIDHLELLWCSNTGTHPAAVYEDPSGHATPYYPWALCQNIFEVFPGCFQSPPGCVFSLLIASYTSMVPSPEKTWP